LRRVADASEDEPMISAFVEAFRFPAVALRYKDVLGAFVRRELKARYEGSLLGRLWPFLQPLIQFAAFGFVFAVILQVPLSAHGAVVGPGWIVVFFMLSGILPWITFAESVQRGANVVLENANLIKKIAFPSELLPAQVVLVATVQQLIALALFVPVYVGVVLGGSDAPMHDRLDVLRHLVGLPLPLLLQIFFSIGLAMLLSSFNVFVRDVGNVVPLAMIIWQFLSPIFYRFDMVEKQVPAWAVSVLHANPLYHLFALWRDAFCYEVGAAYPVQSLLIFGIVSLAVFTAGLTLFRRWKGYFADEV
jgi:ABC-type polysaccharide/polyol phosphate export permease